MATYVYILKLLDKKKRITYYCGVTGNVKERIDRHNKGYGSKYTRNKRILDSKVIKSFKTISEAYKFEKEVKKWKKNKKSEFFK